MTATLGPSRRLSGLGGLGLPRDRRVMATPKKSWKRSRWDLGPSDNVSNAQPETRINLVVYGQVSCMVWMLDPSLCEFLLYPYVILLWCSSLPGSCSESMMLVMLVMPDVIPAVVASSLANKNLFSRICRRTIFLYVWWTTEPKAKWAVSFVIFVQIDPERNQQLQRTTMCNSVPVRRNS